MACRGRKGRGGNRREHGGLSSAQARREAGGERKGRAFRLGQRRLRRASGRAGSDGGHEKRKATDARIWHHRRTEYREDWSLLRRHYPRLRRTPRLVIPIGIRILSNASIGDTRRDQNS